MAAVDLPAPGPGSGFPAGLGAETAPSQEILVTGAGWACSLRVFDAGLACCAVEVAAALRRAGAAAQETGTLPGPGELVNVLVVAGTVTDKLAPLVLNAFAHTPEPRRVISFGACTNSGGPYWDSYCVTKGVDQFIPVDMYVPGCPPRPEALLDGLRRLLEPGGDRAAGAGAGAGAAARTPGQQP